MSEYAITNDVEHGSEESVAKGLDRRHPGEAWISAMLLMKDVGSTRCVKNLLADPRVLSCASAANRFAVAIDDCRTWLVRAEVYEAQNGQHSMINREHPFWVSKIEPTLRKAFPGASLLRTPPVLSGLF